MSSYDKERKPRAYLTRAVHFSASHRYFRPEWSEQENRRRFGDAALAEGHGHNYRCEVTVAGDVDGETGMVIDLETLDGILAQEVLAPLHNRHINTALPEFAPGRALPTTENLAAVILERVRACLPAGVSIHRVRVQEDRDLWSDAYATPAGRKG